MSELRNHYANPLKPQHRINIDAFLKLERETGIKTFWPNYTTAPWHVQAYVNGHLMNFWPCANKANVDREKSVYGSKAITKLVRDVRSRERPENVGVIEE